MICCPRFDHRISLAFLEHSFGIAVFLLSLCQGAVVVRRHVFAYSMYTCLLPRCLIDAYYCSPGFRFTSSLARKIHTTLATAGRNTINYKTKHPSIHVFWFSKTQRETNIVTSNRKPGPPIPQKTTRTKYAVYNSSLTRSFASVAFSFTLS